MKNFINIKISKNFIKNLIYITNLANLINKRINLKKKGNYYISHCPFHNEKNPSFTVNNEKQFYYCFGCNIHGNAIDFLMKYEKLTFVESIKELSIINNVEIIYKNKNITNKLILFNKENLYKIMEKISILYQQNLWGKNGIKAIKYLKNRGLNEDIIKKFSLGLSIFKKDDIFKKFGYNKDNIEFLNKTGMIIIKKKKIYDRFSNRIMFPINNKNKKIIGFGARTFNNNLPKYLNSPETEIFHKSKNFYGLYKFKNKNKIKYILIVEGYIDFIMLKQYKINYVVALLGTFITKYHIESLFQITKIIIFCYDGDTAGKRAAWNSLKVTLPYIKDDKQIKFIFLPDNEDPDTLIRKEGTEKFKKRIKNAITFTNFFFEKISYKLDLNNIYDKIKLSNKALNLISKIPSNLLKINLKKILSIKIGLINDTQLQYWSKHNDLNIKQNFEIKKTNMRNIISLLIQNPKLSKLIPSINKLEIIKKNYPGLDLLIELFNIINKYSNINTGQLLEIYRNNKIIKILSKLNIVFSDNKLIEKVFLLNIINFLILIIKTKIKQILKISKGQNLKLKEIKKINFLNNIILNIYKI
ncbi:MAG: DNA primase [Enterobacteriaceae bacterium]